MRLRLNREVEVKVKRGISNPIYFLLNLSLNLSPFLMLMGERTDD